MAAHKLAASQRIMARRRRYTTSRLDRYRAELVALRKAGASPAELALWLRQSKRVVVECRVTLPRFIGNIA